jgi:hypothetical protein
MQKMEFMLNGTVSDDAPYFSSELVCSGEKIQKKIKHFFHVSLTIKCNEKSVYSGQNLTANKCAFGICDKTQYLWHSPNDTWGKDPIVLVAEHQKKKM